MFNHFGTFVSHFPFPLAAGVLAKQGLATLRVPFPFLLAGVGPCKQLIIKCKLQHRVKLNVSKCLLLSQ